MKFKEASEMVEGTRFRYGYNTRCNGGNTRKI